MASLAVFRQLYDEQQDIYSVISKFAEQIIIENRQRSFELNDMANMINNTYGFKLPKAIIKTSLKKLVFVSCNRTLYTVSEDFQSERYTDFFKLSRDVKDGNQKIISALIAYVEKRRGSLNESEQDVLERDFCAYIIDDSVNTEYGKEITAFLIENSENTSFINQLNQIKQGIIIYVGLSYNTRYDNVDSLVNPLVIYLDTEILFHLAGYNGILYETLFKEFYDLAEQINEKASKRIIYFRYFSETEDEIQSFFRAAEEIIRKRRLLNPSKQAMGYIVQHCKESFEVQEMMSDFFSKLQSMNISLDRQENYYDRNNVEFNIEHEKFLAWEQDGFTAEDINRKLRLLNYISIKRGNKSQEIFRNIGHVLLSGNKLTFSIANDSDVKQEGQVPLAVSLDFLTNRFWLTLNRRIQSNMDLLSFDIVAKARIAFSTCMSKAIDRRFQELISEEKGDDFDIEIAKQRLAFLQQCNLMPEKINMENEDSYFTLLDTGSIDEYIAEQEIQKENLIKENKEWKGKFNKANTDAINAKENLKCASNIILQTRNEKEKEDFIIKRKSHKVEEVNAFKKAFRRKYWKSFFYLITYFGIPVTLYLLSSIVAGKMVLGVIMGVALFLLPIILPLFKIDIIRTSFRFLLCYRERRCFLRRFLLGYLKFNPSPKLYYSTIEDVEKELKFLV